MNQGNGVFDLLYIWNCDFTTAGPEEHFLHDFIFFEKNNRNTKYFYNFVP